MRVFLDTNVVVGAVATRGLCADILREVLARHELVVSEASLEEIKAVLSGKIGVPEALIADLGSLLCEGAIRSAPSGAADLPIRDPADGILVAAALSGKADVFVTGDKELLALRQIGPLSIVSPRDFWERVKMIVNK
jgi:putative PIN family toxin of toxin-antitoxin system